MIWRGEIHKPGIIRCTITMLTHASWPTLKAFDIHTESAAQLPPEAVNVAKVL